MKTWWIYLIVIVTTIFSCEKKEIENHYPTIITTEISDITYNSAKGGGEILTDGNISILSRGVCWSLDQEPTISDSHSKDSSGIGKYFSKIIDINVNSTYYVKAYYITINDTVYGDLVEFVTKNNITFNPSLIYDTVSDFDGNVYKTIKIGNQTWMAENLRVTHYNNGEPIEHIKDESIWNKTNYYGVAKAYCVYNNNEENRLIYGLLYTHGIVSERYSQTRGINSIAPMGWHIPSKEEWSTLINYLGADSIVASLLKESGTVHWILQNVDCTNESGFTALPSGKRDEFGKFSGLGNECHWWSSTYAVIRYYPGCSIDIYSNSKKVHYGRDILFSYPINYGFAVRCVKD